MKYNNYTGVIYDSIYYSLICFNKEAAREQLKIISENESNVFKYYDEFLKEEGFVKPPEDIYPFFYYKLGMPCVMTEYFRNNYEFFNGTYSNFIDLIKDIPAFKRFVFYYYIETFREDIDITAAINGDPIELGKVLIILKEYHGDKTGTFLQLFYNFEGLVDELITYFNILYQRMNIFHSKRKNLIKEAINKFCADDIINVYKKNYEIKDEVNFSKQTFSVCFINQYIILHKGKNENSEYSFTLGCNSCSVAWRVINYKFVDHCSISRIFANDIMNDIINELMKEDLTITKLSQRLHVSRATMDRHINNLYDNLAIKVLRKNGNEKYYSINTDYFIAGKAAFIDKIDKVIDCGRKCDIISNRKYKL